ncbi:aminotransferase class V-fold PLP-dependent enzyme [Bacillus luteolus]|uniref:Aminotransferase class V-fold PLP-dependent enzyme n=1 Tax=Litchfieldia luteola TaxID=682179 RepID=A0ABR9QN24_9BACI|nr:aminotransferase class V-fold PLP-dependent enzyme [Cytobacillus luteolus]MBE4909903.1 aminotransferase class V-fold PLP-dependent enzyme [Cytobacillus luteolus]MBP1942542.1 selenocysteine lyase/cysteine desulfurase [Cytobacillus luteolus]
MLKARIGSNNYEMYGELETYFQQFRNGIIGNNQEFVSPYGLKKIIYADWMASGRLYKPIEDKICNEFGPFMANTHTDSNLTGAFMTEAYEEAKRVIKAHVNANHDDCLIFAGAGMTAAINKLQRIIGLKIPEQLRDKIKLDEQDKPIIFVSHMEHHSNHTSWLETIGEVCVVEPDSEGNVCPEKLNHLLLKYNDRKMKIGSFSACSNVTGIETPYYELAKVMHKHGGYCFVDFAASAPYVKINMHPENEVESLDAIFFSPHKFLGGPGTSGVVVFNSKLYSTKVPDHPGGGTVSWTNPWGMKQYITDIEKREDGGTPGILQAIRIALCIRLKEQMGEEKILQREHELVSLLLKELNRIPGLLVLEANKTNRLGIVSFCVENLHYNLVVKLLNDRYGFQVRGGCSCAGTYGHYLFSITKEDSKKITDLVDLGDQSTKPGWVRFSIHPTMTNEEIYLFITAIRDIVRNAETWKKDYVYNSTTNDFYYIDQEKVDTRGLFRVN